MVNRWGATSTKADTINRFGELFDEGDDPAEVAKRWNDAGFDDEATERWLQARCFDPEAARELADLGVTPGQASTSAYKVAKGQLSARQGAARAASSR